MSRKLSIFWSKGFIIGLIILLLNDHFLKSQFHNWFTGKLSDVAGLFIFPLFFAAFLPKYKRHIYWIIAIGFIWWKSPLVNGFIELFNGLNIFTISRVMDWTDLLALAVLPFSYYYFTTYKSNSFKLHPLPVMMLASFAFIATSKSPDKIEYYKEYSFQYSIDSLKKKIFFHKNINNQNKDKWLQYDTIKTTPGGFSQQYLEICKKNLEIAFFDKPMWISIVDTANTCSLFSAQISVEQNRQISKLVLKEFSYRYCKNTKDKAEDKDQLIKIFEEKIIKPLNE